MEEYESYDYLIEDLDELDNKQDICDFRANFQVIGGAAPGHNKYVYCDICDRIMRKERLTKHLKLHMEKVNFHCNYNCGKRFLTANHLTDHESQYHSKEFNKMKTNLKSFLSKNYVQNERGKKAVETCPYCERQLPRQQLVRHIKTHIGDKTYKCDVCSKYFMDSTTLGVHKEAAHGDTVYNCLFCAVTFKTMANTKSHMRRIHPLEYNERKTYFEELKTDVYICDYCNKKCSSRKMIVHHLKEHTFNKIKSCEFCLKNIPMYKMASHLRTHRAKDFKCKICSKAFNRASNLRGHMSRIHIKTEVCACPICDKTFSNDKDCLRHAKNHNQVSHKKLKCLRCPLTFSVYANLERHMKLMHLTLSSVLICDFCGKRGFGSKDELMLHESTVHRSDAYKIIFV